MSSANPSLRKNVGFRDRSLQPRSGIGDSAFQRSQFLSKQTQCHQLGKRSSLLIHKVARRNKVARRDKVAKRRNVPSKAATINEDP